jgi:4-hydroxyphenylpyruvate dioxygenase
VAGQFVRESFGSSIQHLALTTDDIFQTASRLARYGFRVLEIPANYYGDLAARLGLDDGLIARLRVANILYDRDEQGEFFQLYGQTSFDGFFLEIVERKGGYRGYGAANAPFRIAAQRRALGPTVGVRIG